MQGGKPLDWVVGLGKSTFLAREPIELVSWP